MAILIYDPMMEAEVRQLRVGRDDARQEECWEGVTVMSPLPNNEHQNLVTRLLRALIEVVEDTGLGTAFPDVNISDRADAWTHNYRNPDAAIYLHTNPAVDRGTFWQGGPDFLVEIVSPGEPAHAKLGFYAQVNTREVLIVHRDPWALELFTLQGGQLVPAGRSDVADPGVLLSGAVGLAFRLVEGPRRPQIEMTHPPTGRVWLA